MEFDGYIEKLKQHKTVFYILGLAIFVFIIAVLSDPQKRSEIFNFIAGLLFWLIVFLFILGACCSGARQQQQQQQQQQVIVQTAGTKMRVCQKCGMQNDVTSRYCSDCGYELPKRRY